MTSVLFICTLFCMTIIIYLSARIKRDKTVKQRFVPYVNGRAHKKTRGQHNQEPLHLYVAFCNHLSPFRGNVSQEIAEHRVVTWQREYTRFASEHRDSLGNQPVHTFFYDEADYNPRFIDVLYKMCKSGIADVEILLRHGQNTPLNFKHKVEGFRDVLFHHHGLLRRNSEAISFAFVHDYTAPGDTRPQKLFDDTNQKRLMLKECGCYADFTLTNRKKRAAMKNRDDDLLLIAEPLGTSWRTLLPRKEFGEISARSRFTPRRARMWLDAAPQINGGAKNIFLKLHTYGAVDSTVRYLFGESGIYELYGYLEKASVYNSDFILHYVSAYEMYRRIQAVCMDNRKMSDRVCP
ncbi:MAG: hypothetical protein FWE57_01125 [Chitinispirillia bacterium]|nr:hypothetical protein [Chitinispirillia bacterium]